MQMCEAQTLLISCLKMVNGGHFIAVHSIFSHMKFPVSLYFLSSETSFIISYTQHILLSTDSGRKTIVARSGC